MYWNICIQMYKRNTICLAQGHVLGKLTAQYLHGKPVLYIKSAVDRARLLEFMISRR